MRIRMDRQCGLSLVELMVGMAVGLIVSAVALAALVHHLRECQRLVAEARLMHDLRTVAELMSRDLRRAGAFALTAQGLRLSRAGQSEELAYRLQDSVIDMKIGNGHWQAMTDAETLRIESLRVVPHTRETTLDGFCGKPCAPGNAQCPPRVQLRSVDIEVSARSSQDPGLTRSARTTVQLRHDTLVGTCPA